MQSWFTIELNGERRRFDNVPVGETLSDGLRGLGAVATRSGDELVIVLDHDGERGSVFKSIDSGGVPLVAMAGRRIWTVDGLREGFPHHPLWEMENRYPHIDPHPQRREHLSALLFEWCAVPPGRRGARLPSGFVSRTADYAGIQRMVDELGGMEAGEVTKIAGEKLEVLEEVQYVDDAQHRFYRPQTIVELFDLKRQASGAKLLAGGIEMCRGGGMAQSGPGVFLSVEGIDEMRALVDEGSHWQIGAALPLAELMEKLGNEFPALLGALDRFESGPVRNRATLAGQLNTALGRAELGPVLLALGARVRLASAEGARDLTLDSFYGNKAGSVLRQNEIIASVSLPRNTPEMLGARDCELRFCDAYKVAARRSSCSGWITAGFAVELDGDGRVTQSVLAFGGLGERPLLAVGAAVALKGKPWDHATVAEAVERLDEEVAALATLDGGDIRRSLVATLFQKFHYQSIA